MIIGNQVNCTRNIYRGRETIPAVQRCQVAIGSDASKAHHKDDCLVIGYVDALKKRLDKDEQFIPIGNTGNAFYHSYRYRCQQQARNINLLAVKFSFWGDMAGHIARLACQHGITELIYYSKVGTMVGADKLYKTIYTPSHFALIDGANVGEIYSCRNELQHYLHRATEKMHVSVPTVMEETFAQRECALSIDAKTIDNEVAYIAKSVADHNVTVSNPKAQRSDSTKGIIKLGIIHFATDYIYDKSEVFDEERHNLSTNKSESAVALKQQIMAEVNDILASYLATDEMVNSEVAH